jgi:hypothetical protein
MASPPDWCSCYLIRRRTLSRQSCAPWVGLDPNCFLLERLSDSICQGTSSAVTKSRRSGSSITAASRICTASSRATSSPSAKTPAGLSPISRPVLFPTRLLSRALLVLSGTFEQVLSAVQANVVPGLVRCLRDEDHRVRKEAGEPSGAYWLMSRPFVTVAVQRGPSPMLRT